MNSDGSSPLRITTTPGLDKFPSFSPDGTKIAYSHFDSDYEAHLMNADGSGDVTLSAVGGSNEIVYGWQSIPIVVVPPTPGSGDGAAPAADSLAETGINNSVPSIIALALILLAVFSLKTNTKRR
jgi:hypothetical protein